MSQMDTTTSTVDIVYTGYPARAALVLTLVLYSCTGTRGTRLPGTECSMHAWSYCCRRSAMRWLAQCHPISIPRGARAAAALPTMSGCVPETASRPSAPLFAAQHIKAQRPVVLRGYCQDWRATQHWHDPAYLRQLAGDDRLLSVERSEDGHFSYASGHGRTTVPLGIAISLF